jgi:hypothetical protein
VPQRGAPHPRGHCDVYGFCGFPCRARWKPRDDCIEEIPTALADGGGYPDGVAEAQLIEVVLGGAPLQIVELVHREKHRAVGPSKPLGDGLVHRRHTRGSVHQEQYEV